MCSRLLRAASLPSSHSAWWSTVPPSPSRSAWGAGRAEACARRALQGQVKANYEAVGGFDGDGLLQDSGGARSSPYRRCQAFVRLRTYDHEPQAYRSTCIVVNWPSVVRDSGPSCSDAFANINREGP